jgi:hypothetical protein
MHALVIASHCRHEASPCSSYEPYWLFSIVPTLLTAMAGYARWCTQQGTSGPQGPANEIASGQYLHDSL